MNRLKLLVGLLVFIWAGTLPAQYGAGAGIEVPQVDPAALTLDGDDAETEWLTARSVDILANWSGDWSGNPEADLEATTKLLWAEDTLYVFAHFVDFQEFFWGTEGNPWGGEQLLIGIDGTHEGDDQTNGDWSGNPENAPDLGATVYKVWKDGITLNWGYGDAGKGIPDGVSPVDSGWARGTVVVDDVNFEWKVEMAIYVPQLAEDVPIGFNIAGATASAEYAAGGDDGAYAYFQYIYGPGGYAGDFAEDAAGLGTLYPVTTGYGAGAHVEVPYVDPTALTLDGDDAETEWLTARSVDILANWSGDWSGNPEADLEATTKLLWAEDTLYVFAHFVDFQEFFWGTEGNPWGGEQLLIGIDGTHAGDDQTNGDWSGNPENAPDLGATVYKVWKDGITLNWGYGDAGKGIPDGVSPVDSGWARGTVVVDDVNFEWKVEMAIYVPQIGEGSSIGFNIAGATASADFAAGGDDGAYAYFQYIYGPGGYAGDFAEDAGGLGTADFFGSVPVAIEDGNGGDVPSAYKLSQNYPNPFNPSTNIIYEVTERAHITLTVYNLLGQQVATLVDAERLAGSHRVSWNAAGMASGIYVYRLAVNGQPVETRKALLLR